MGFSMNLLLEELGSVMYVKMALTINRTYIYGIVYNMNEPGIVIDFPEG